MWDNINVRATNTATITGSAAGTATFTVVQKRNEGPYSWTTLRDGSLEVTAGNLAYMNDGNATLLDGHVNSTEFDGPSGPVDPPRNAVIQVTGLNLPLYDVIIYFGASEGYGSGCFIDFNNGGLTAFNLPAGQPSTTLDEIESAGATGNYIKYSNVIGSSFSARIYGQGFNHLGPSGIQIREVAAVARITSFGISGSTGVIDQNAKTISLTVPFGTNLTTLAPTFTLGSGTCNQTSGSPPSPTFASANPATYTVTDGATVNTYTATVTVTPVGTASDILTFNANFPGSSATITTLPAATGSTVVIEVPPGTSGAQIAALAPSYTLSPFATCPQPNPGIPTIPLSTTTPVTYTVTAQDGSTTKNYAVSVIAAALPPSLMALTGDAVTSAGYFYAPNEVDGYTFTVGATAINASWLGWYDAPNTNAASIGDGFMGEVKVGLWANDGTLLATTTLNAGVSGTGMSGSFRGRYITPVTLSAGQTYTIGGYGAGGNRIHAIGATTGFGINGITMGVGVYGYSWPARPTATWSYLIGPNFGGTIATPPPTATLVIDLGTSPAGTTIAGGSFIGSGPTNLPLPTLPVGSILRSIAVSSKLEATDNENYASDLALLLDPTPGTPGGDFSVEITNGTAPLGGTALNLDWPSAAEGGVGTLLANTKTDAAWAAAGPIDLATTGLFLGNAYRKEAWASPQGATWSGIITLTYDLVGTASKYEDWANGELFENDKNGDGVKNGLAFLLGAATPDENALGRLPVPSNTATGLKLNFSILKAADRGAAAAIVQWSNDLGLTDPWSANVAAVPPSTSFVNGVDFQVESSGALDVIQATIPSTEAAAGKLFGRLSGEGN